MNNSSYKKANKKSSSKRTNFEIWSEILEACIRIPRTQTWLLRNIRLKTKKIQKTIVFLLSRKLIEKKSDGDTITYITSQKGKETLLKYYNLITAFFEL